MTIRKKLVHSSSTQNCHVHKVHWKVSAKQCNKLNCCKKLCKEISPTIHHDRILHTNSMATFLILGNQIKLLCFACKIK